MDNARKKYIEGTIEITRWGNLTCTIKENSRTGWSPEPLRELKEGETIEIQDPTLPLWEQPGEWIPGILENEKGAFYLNGGSTRIKLESATPVRIEIRK